MLVDIQGYEAEVAIAAATAEGSPWEPAVALIEALQTLEAEALCVKSGMPLPKLAVRMLDMGALEFSAAFHGTEHRMQIAPTLFAHPDGLPTVGNTTFRETSPSHPHSTLLTLVFPYFTGAVENAVHVCKLTLLSSALVG